MEHAAFQLMSRDQAWHVEWLTLLDTCQPLTSVCPAVVPAIPMGGPAEHVWPIKRNRAAKRAVQQPPPPPNTLPADAAEPEEDEFDVDQGLTDLPAADDDDEQQLPEVMVDVLEAAQLTHQAKGRKRKTLVPEASAFAGAASSSEVPAHLSPVLTHTEARESEPVQPNAPFEENVGLASAVAAAPPDDAQPEREQIPNQAVHAGEVLAPKAPPARPAHRQGGVRMAAVATASLESGQISFYPNKQCFQATCGVHPACVLTRTCNGRTSRGAVIGGRPLGFMTGWLSIAHECGSKEEHWQRERWTRDLTQHVRAEARHALLRSRGGPELAVFEREQEAGEPEEPDSLQGLLR